MFSQLRSCSAKAFRSPLPLSSTSYRFPLSAAYLPSPSRQITMASATSFYDFEPLDKEDTPFPLGKLKGKVVLVVNTASKCRFTPQFEGLEKLYQSFKESHPDAFTILGFPCNQFGGQDPGTNEAIQEFCQVNYGVSFPILGKVDVNGDNAAPVWNFMKEKKPGILGFKGIKWNFEKFLISADGDVVGRWSSLTPPQSDAIQKLILEEIGKAEKMTEKKDGASPNL